MTRKRKRKGHRKERDGEGKWRGEEKWKGEWKNRERKQWKKTNKKVGGERQRDKQAGNVLERATVVMLIQVRTRMRERTSGT